MIVQVDSFVRVRGHVCNALVRVGAWVSVFEGLFSTVLVELRSAGPSDTPCLETINSSSELIEVD